MKFDTCSFSGYKIYPGHGMRQVKVDGKVITLLSSKTRRFHNNKINARKVRWTQVYRRLHKKGVFQATVEKKLVEKADEDKRKVIRGIGAMSIEAIMRKQKKKVELTKEQKEEAIKKAKEASAKKKADKTKKAAAPTHAEKAPKPVKSAQPRVGGKR